MSDTASLENCKELAEISGWLTNEDADHYWYKNEAGEFEIRTQEESEFYHADEYYPLYTAGYLLRKLPIEHKDWGITLRPNVARTLWICGYKSDHNLDVTGETPEDALCKLAIELHKAGILPISGRDL